ncbi:YobI family P-loop NTPase [Mycoplasmopsis gallinacea]|uniref:YobI-like P-loop NTPase domain-containing protein n=1 Tax=Mycoplasmopsis gallinacea TaxID=29556 RepID=A0A6H0V699_9BACT|nr:hypothetical protein [Mycoplasmopsis gallinacea]QIW62503.1 hypothetical protein GOQ20_03730 [Mycoplasmopsis gallinacea]
MDNKKDKNTFFALSPKILDKEEMKTSFSKCKNALDHALNNDDITNIGIIGHYGAGKSSFINTYIKENNIKNVITISLPHFSSNDKTNNADKEINELNNENRLEKQIINQILSQVEPKRIFLSKYSFKINKPRIQIFFYTILTISFIFSLILWFYKDYWNNLFHWQDTNNLIILCAISFLIPISFFIFIFFKKKILKISKLSFKGAEAKINDLEKNDETIFDKDIREIVYLIANSKSDIVIIEDLDRNNNVDIFVKLRELNFLINKYKENVFGRKRNFNLFSPQNKNVVKFIYLAKGSMFSSEENVKFFDFIIPIIPVADFMSSSDKLRTLIDDGVKEKTIFYLSEYISDMRILNNILNEFYIYKDILAINTNDTKINNNSSNNIETDKLITIIILKNLMPQSFELFFKREGIIYEIWKDLSHNNEKVIEKISSINEDEKIKDFLRMIVENKYFDESFEYYVSTFYKQTQNRNNELFIKHVKENPDKLFKTDIKFEKVEEVIWRLRNKHFKTISILNIDILESLGDDEQDKIELILDNFKKEYKDILERLYEEFRNNNKKVQKIIIWFLNKTLNDEKNKGFKDWIINLKNSESLTTNEHSMFKFVFTICFINFEIEDFINIFKEFPDFIKNKKLHINCNFFEKEFKKEIKNKINEIRDYSIKFFNLSYLDLDNEQIEKLISKKLLSYNINDFMDILKNNIKEKETEITMKNLFKVLFENKEKNSFLKKFWKFFDDNSFSLFINYTKSNNYSYHSNGEDVLKRVLDSDLNWKYKLKYVEKCNKNEKVLKSLSDFTNWKSETQILDILFSNNCILFNKENFNLYVSNQNELSNAFIQYLTNNINEKNYTEYLDKNNTKLLHNIINNNETKGKLLEFVLQLIDYKLVISKASFSLEKLKTIIKKGKLSINIKNFQLLIENKFIKEFIELYQQVDTNNDRDNILNQLNLIENDQLLNGLSKLEGLSEEEEKTKKEIQNKLKEIDNNFMNIEL